MKDIVGYFIDGSILVTKIYTYILIVYQLVLINLQIEDKHVHLPTDLRF